jgi:hypothetical protein
VRAEGGFRACCVTCFDVCCCWLAVGYGHGVKLFVARGVGPVGFRIWLGWLAGVLLVLLMGGRIGSGCCRPLVLDVLLLRNPCMPMGGLQRVKGTGCHVTGWTFHFLSTTSFASFLLEFWAL